MLAIHNLQRMRGALTIIKQISAEVKAGDVVALLGKNGAGKTTLLETLLGFAFPSRGEVLLWGQAAAQIDGEIKQRIGFVPQQSELLPSLSGHEHVRLFKAYRSHWNQALVDRLVIDWCIPLDQAVGKMSVGQQQKLSILLALAHEPELLVLDEPVASLDPVARRQFLQQLVAIAADEHRAIIFSSHILSDMERIATQVWMLQDGYLSYQGGLDELKESVVRLSISASEPLPVPLAMPHIIKQRLEGRQAQVTLSHWQPQLQEHWQRELKAHIQVEYLALEEIFVELNS